MTCYTVFNCKNNDKTEVTLNLVINGQQISKMSSCKYLGVFIDAALIELCILIILYTRAQNY